MKRIYLYVMLMLIFASSCGNKTKDVDAELKAEADRVNAVVAQIERGEDSVRDYVQLWIARLVHILTNKVRL